MPTWLRILLAVMAACVLALVLVGVLAYRWIKTRGPELLERGKATQTDARKFAEGKQSKDCVDEGLRRVRETKDFFGMIDSRLFVDECLRAADEPADFCNGVPAGVLRGALWPNEQCANQGMKSNQGCVGVYQSVLEHCRAKAAPDGTSSR